MNRRKTRTPQGPPGSVIIALVAAALGAVSAGGVVESQGAGPGAWTPPRALFAFGDEPGPPGTTREPTGLAVAGDGRLLVVDRAFHRVQAFTSKGELMGAWASLGHEDGRLAFPSSITAGRDGIVTVHDTGNRRLARFLPDGTFAGAWVLPLAGATGGHRAAGQGSPPAPPAGIAALPDGGVLATTPDSPVVARFSNRGALTAVWGATGTPTFQRPAGIAVGTDAVYVADPLAGTVVRMDMSGATLPWSPQGLSRPVAVAVDRDGVVLVADTGAGAVLRLAALGALLGRLESPDAPQPVAVAVLQDGTVAVADAGGAITTFDASGRAERNWGGYDAAADLSPTALVVTSDSHLLVADDKARRVRRYTGLGLHVGDWPSGGSFETTPGAVGAAGDRAYVALPDSRNVLRFSRTGNPLGPVPGSQERFERPVAVLGAETGGFYAVDQTRRTVGHYADDGAVIGEWGPAELTRPSALARVGEEILVADEGANKVVRYHPAGELSGSWGTLGAAAGRLDGPRGLAALGKDSVAVIDAHPRLQAFGLGGAFLGQWGYPGAFLGSTTSPVAVAGDGNGRVYVADNVLGRVTAYGPPAGWHMAWFDNRWLAGKPRNATEADAMAFGWANRAPVTELPVDGWSMRGRQVVAFEPGVYSFTMEWLGGARLWVGRRIVIDSWGASGTRKVEVAVGSGATDVVVEFNDPGGEAAVSLSWSQSAGAGPIYLPTTATSRGRLASAAPHGLRPQNVSAGHGISTAIVL